MRRLSWNVRLVLGVIVFLIIAAIVFVIYYNVTRSRLDKAMEVKAYPGADLIFEENQLEGNDRLYYEVKNEAISTVNQKAQEIENFYENEEYTCRALYNNSEYVYSTCLLEKTHFLGFDRFNRIMIVPLKNADGTLAGSIGIDIRRNWGANGGIGN